MVIAGVMTGMLGSHLITNCECPKKERARLGDGEQSVLAKIVIPLAGMVGERRGMLLHTALLPLPLLPIVLTHTLPAAVVWAPVTLLIAGVWVACAEVYRRRRERLVDPSDL